MEPVDDTIPVTRSQLAWLAQQEPHLRASSTDQSALDAFVTGLHANGWISVFDWLTWSQTGLRIIAEGGIAAADPATLRHLLTMYVRADRFTEGALAAAHEAGVLERICSRAGELLVAPA